MKATRRAALAATGAALAATLAPALASAKAPAVSPAVRDALASLEAADAEQKAAYDAADAIAATLPTDALFPKWYPRGTLRLVPGFARYFISRAEAMAEFDSALAKSEASARLAGGKHVPGGYHDQLTEQRADAAAYFDRIEATRREAGLVVAEAREDETAMAYYAALVALLDAPVSTLADARAKAKALQGVPLEREELARLLHSLSGEA